MGITDLFAGGGFIMWPLLVIAIGVVAATVMAVTRSRNGTGREDTERAQISILFWGTMAPVHGLLGTVIGLMQMGYVIQRAGAEATTVWGGITVAMIPLGFGLLIFVFAMLAWFSVRMFSGRGRVPVTA